MDFYTTFDIERILSIKRTRLQEWLRLGHIKASQASSGLGSKALFSIDDLYNVQLFFELISMGLDRSIASEVFYWIKGDPIPMQVKPVDWSIDFLNVYVDVLEKRLGQKEPTKSITLIYYGDPEIIQYRSPKSRAEYGGFMQWTVNLRIIKEIVDQRIQSEK